MLTTEPRYATANHSRHWIRKLVSVKIGPGRDFFILRKLQASISTGAQPVLFSGGQRRKLRFNRQPQSNWGVLASGFSTAATTSQMCFSCLSLTSGGLAPEYFGKVVSGTPGEATTRRRNPERESGCCCWEQRQLAGIVKAFWKGTSGTLWL